MKINAQRIEAIKQRIAQSRKDLARECSDEDRLMYLKIDLTDLVKDAGLMLEIIEEIRIDAHYCEEAESFVLGVADLLGTNCESGSKSTIW